jgi:hypothetical protein
MPINFSMSVCLCIIYLGVTTCEQVYRFQYLILGSFIQIFRHIPILIDIGQLMDTFNEDQHAFLHGSGRVANTHSHTTMLGNHL